MVIENFDVTNDETTINEDHIISSTVDRNSLLHENPIFVVKLMNGIETVRIEWSWHGEFVEPSDAPMLYFNRNEDVEIIVHYNNQWTFGRIQKQVYRYDNSIL